MRGGGAFRVPPLCFRRASWTFLRSAVLPRPRPQFAQSQRKPPSALKASKSHARHPPKRVLPSRSSMPRARQPDVWSTPRPDGSITRFLATLMPTISASASASPAFQQGFAQLKVQQAKRNAEQAEANARTLQAQAADAQRTAQRAQESARDLTVRSDQAQSAVGRAREGLAAIRSLSDTSTRLQQTYERVAASIQEKDGVGETAPAVEATVSPQATTVAVSAASTVVSAPSSRKQKTN